MEVINADCLARQVYTGLPHESLKKKIATEKYARKLRTIFGNNCFDFDLIIWIHKLIIDRCSFMTVVSYLSVLQVLRTKVSYNINFISLVFMICICLFTYANHK